MTYVILCPVSRLSLHKLKWLLNLIVRVFARNILYRKYYKWWSCGSSAAPALPNIRDCLGWWIWATHLWDFAETNLSKLRINIVFNLMKCITSDCAEKLGKSPVLTNISRNCADCMFGRNKKWSYYTFYLLRLPPVAFRQVVKRLRKWILSTIKNLD